MRTVITIRQLRGRSWAGLGMFLLLGSAALPDAMGREPLVPLPPPAYSFDANSPAVQGTIVAAGDALLTGPSMPTVAIPRAALGLNSIADDIDGLSAANALVGFSDTFTLLFSVDRQTLGAAEPDPQLLAAGIPFNVFDQARRGQAAGDQFMSTGLFTRAGPLPFARGAQNGVLVRNNFDEGGTDFMAQPSTSAQDNVAGSLRSRVAQDNVDAAAKLDRLGMNGAFVNVYFSLTAGSPSLPSLSNGVPPSGANIFFNAQPGIEPTTLYAAASQLGLQPVDDIDAILVFDTNQNGLFDAGDQVIFSLTPGSPSLASIPGTSQMGRGADLLSVSYGQPPALFASAAQLGLGAPPDNIDALDLLPCANGFACAVQHGIRSFPGDVNCDHVINYADINPFVLALGDQAAYKAHFPNCNWYNADCNGDGTVNYADINPFVRLLSGTP